MFFVAHHPQLRAELVRSARQLNLLSHGRLAATLQISIIWLLMPSRGILAIVQHPKWFGGVPTAGHALQVVFRPMIDKAQGYDVVADFWEWYQRRWERQSAPLANHALDKCEEAFTWRDWERFGYWHATYLRERVRAQIKRATE